jgi:hypothetical protein
MMSEYKMENQMINRVAAAGMTFTLFLAVVLFLNNMNLYEFAQIVRNWMLWALFFGYAVASSLIIDRLFKNKKYGEWRIVIYALAGSAVFFVFGVTIFAIYASVFGALTAIVYFFCLKIVPLSKLTRITFGFALPLFFLVFVQFDHTQKLGFAEQVTDGKSEISVVDFSGEHFIPLKLQQGDIVNVKIQFENVSGSYGYRLNYKNDYYPMDEVSDDVISFVAEQAGDYDIVVTGNRFGGKILVEWTVKSEGEL